MPKVAVRSLETARAIAPSLVEYFGEGHPIHLTLHRLSSGEGLALKAGAVARLAYAWTGAVEVGGYELPAGSTVIVERDAAAELIGRAAESQVLVFAAASEPAHPRSGGHVHILPRGQAPRVEGLGASGVGGTLFADGGCPTCEVWLHENRFPASDAPPAEPRAGIHSHEENEIIFVTGGEMRLGNRSAGPGTAIAIAAGTLYGFLPGPAGLTFVNFRAGRPGLIHFADGRTADEVAVWSKMDRPLEYLRPLA
jgi:hypothetical protein